MVYLWNDNWRYVYLQLCWSWPGDCVIFYKRGINIIGGDFEIGGWGTWSTKYLRPEGNFMQWLSPILFFGDKKERLLKAF